MGIFNSYVSLPKVYLHIIVLFVCLHAKCAYKDIMCRYYRYVYIDIYDTYDIYYTILYIYIYIILS